MDIDIKYLQIKDMLGNYPHKSLIDNEKDEDFKKILSGLSEEL